MQIAATIRRLRPDLKLILGGPHVTLVYSAKKLEKKRGVVNGRGHRSAAQLEAAFDVLCSGDGELAIFEALKDDAPKVIDGDDPKGGLFLTDQMFTEGPLPARHLVDLKSYRYSIEGHRATSLIAQLGCPFGCGFCGGRNSKSLRQIRNRSIGVDPGRGRAPAPRARLHRLHVLRRRAQRQQKLRRADERAVRPAIAARRRVPAARLREVGAVHAGAGRRRCIARASAGCCAASRPRTSASSSTSTSGPSSPTTTAASATPSSAGLKIKALMSCGHPGESEQTVTDIRDWLIRNQVDDFDCTVITTYPGTPYYDLAVPHATEPRRVDLHASEDRRPAARPRGRLHGVRRLLQRRSERRLPLVRLHRPSERRASWSHCATWSSATCARR